MKARILAIDDEMPWLENFKAWIPEEMADQDLTDSTSKAVELLRRYRHDVVLLDLSMDISDQSNRDNAAIQEYLATRPDGTQYIVVSGTAEKQDVRNAAFHLNACDFIFKGEIDPAMLREKVGRAIELASKHPDSFVADAKLKLTDAGKLDSQILATLNPKGGNRTLFPMIDTLFRRIAPIASHRNRPRFGISDDCVLGLVWSRRIGKAVSIVLANNSIPEHDSRRRLADWLGYAHEYEPWFSRETDRVRIEIFEEPSISDQHFELPLSSASS